MEPDTPQDSELAASFELENESAPITRVIHSEPKVAMELMPTKALLGHTVITVDATETEI